MKAHVFHAHILARSPSSSLGVSLFPLKTTCCMKESKKDEGGNEEILVALEKLKKIGRIEKNFRIDFDGEISLPTLYASLARVFYTFFSIEKYELVKFLLATNQKSVISFLGGFSFINEMCAEKISAGEIGMVMVKTKGIARPSPYVFELKNALIGGNIERIGLLCEKELTDPPKPLQKIWSVVHSLRQKGVLCYLSSDFFPLVITHQESLGEIINTLQIKNFDVEVVTPSD